jgi:hypothetical protein
MIRIGFALWMLAAGTAMAAPAVRPDHPIIGTWKHPVGDTCTEVRTYRTDGTMHVTSGEEVSDSTYEISDQPNLLGAYALTQSTVSVNGKPDCWGAVTPPGTKETIRLSLSFNAKRDRMDVCLTTGPVSGCAGFTRVPDPR